MKRKSKPRPMRNAQGATRAEDLLKPEGKRESLEQYQERMTLGHHFAALEQDDWDAFSTAFPLLSDTP
jgi:hypothetical protein